MINYWFQPFCCMIVGFLILTSYINCMDSNDDPSDISADKRFLLALPTPKRRPMYGYGYRPDYIDSDEDLVNEDKRFLLGLPPKVEYKRFLLGLPPSHRQHKRFILGLPAPTRFHS
ncbi:hypothetical protein MS3_00006162 [Schistosoma haematobium]|uniref:Uncharacterized protein n=1 Tax=Schistosoma haematobium TaxID=6185 RepID=A0A922IQ01_SCHHA|nr:hypothetical protein MS3_00006162 [Schistosoma haematobium]KAH9584627.1 hypothetical protein MS3_00006162 [Schistosoma haematobium]